MQHKSGKSQSQESPVWATIHSVTSETSLYVCADLAVSPLTAYREEEWMRWAQGQRERWRWAVGFTLWCHFMEIVMCGDAASYRSIEQHSLLLPKWKEHMNKSTDECTWVGKHDVLPHLEDIIWKLSGSTVFTFCYFVCLFFRLKITCGVDISCVQDDGTKCSLIKARSSVLPLTRYKSSCLLLPEMKIIFEYDRCGAERTLHLILEIKHIATSGGNMGKIF